MDDAVTPLHLHVASAELMPPERYEVDSDRLKWPLFQSNGVPGLPDGIAIMPTARSHAAVLKALDKLCAVCVLQIRALFCKVMSQPLKWPLMPYKLSRC